MEHGASPNHPKLDIFLADDDPDDCVDFQQALEELPLYVTLTIVKDGEKLLHLLRKRADQLPTVLFLDLNMPRKNGYECLVEIKKDEKLKELPVIIYSTPAKETVMDLLLSNGAHSYIQKPSDYNQLKELIYQALKEVTQKQS